MTPSPVAEGFDPARSWWHMTVPQRAELLERMAQRLEHLSFPREALSVRHVGDKLMEKHSLPPLTREPRDPLVGPGAFVRMYEISKWTLSPEGIEIPMTTILRQSAVYLSYVLDRDQQRDRGPER